MENKGEQFLHQRQPELHTSPEVEHEQERKDRLGEDTSQKPVEKIADWLKVIEKTHFGHEDEPAVLERIKNYYHKEHIIKPDQVPESYFANQQRMARELGHGDIEITDQQRKELTEVIIADQESTLDKWVDYLSHPDSSSFPTWAKYWAFNGMVKLSSFDKEKHTFGKRREDTVAPFPDLNREALAYTIDAAVKTIHKEKVLYADDNPELQKLLQGLNFGKLYAYAIEKVTPTEQNELVNTEGEWIKYNQNSDHMPLVNSLQGYGTGWCTAGETTAETQLKGGDFYVYYSKDKEGKNTIPRVAIRMEQNNIAEVRGIAPEQNLDPYINDIVQEKMTEFPDGEEYQKKVVDMKRLTEIDKKHKLKQELTKEDLRFLYEIDYKIQGFGYQDDPRIKEIINSRDIREDLSQITGYSKEQISLTQDEALSGNIKFHYGSLFLNYLTSAEGLELPEKINGYLNLSRLTSAEGLKLPEKINGALNLDSLTSAEGLELPEKINGSLNLRNLTSAEGLKLPEKINGYLDLSRLTSAEGLELPETINSYLMLASLRSAEGLKLPETINGSLSLYSLTSAEKQKLRNKHPNLKIL